MGFFDLLTPALLWVDDGLADFLSTSWRLLFWSLVSALISVFIFKKFSQTEQIATLKNEIKSTQKALNDHEGEFSELKTLAKRSIVLSLKRMKLTFLPALLSAVPVVFILVFLSHRYDFIEPMPGTMVAYDSVVEGENLSDQLSWTNTTTDQVTGEYFWPEKDQQVQVSAEDGTVLINMSDTPVSIVHKKQWWNVLFANPAGYISAEASVEEIHFEHQQQSPGLLFEKFFSSWVWPYFLSTLFFSVLLIVVFKVRF